ncbi:MAG TPA: sugar ABC transporter substrate-binding protein [Longimicrobiales bacterium]
MRTLRRMLPLLALGACAAPPTGEAPVTLRFWGMGREGEVVAELVREFERRNPAIRVEVQQIPWTAAHEKLLTAYVGGATPDVAQLGNTWVPEFAEIGALEPLDARVAASVAVGRDAYFPGIWQTNIVGDTLRGVPWYVDTRVLFYRRDLLAAAGYDSIPDTWAGWLEAMRAIKRHVGPERYAIFLPTNEWMQPVLLGEQAGATLLRSGGRYGAFRAPAFRRGFDFYLQMYREGLAPPLGHYDIANAYQEFERGYFAMWITGPWNLGEFRRRLSPQMQDRWATAPLPGPTGAESGVSHAGGASLVLFRGSRHKDAAWKLIEYLSEPEQQLRFYELTGSLPARMDAWRRSGLAEGEHTRAFWVQLQRVRALPAVPEIESIMTKVIEHAEASIRGGVPAEASLAALDAAVDRILEKRRWMLDRRAAADRDAGTGAAGAGRR